MQGNNMNEQQQGFYQNLSVYAKHNETRPELERPFIEMAYEIGDEKQISNSQQISSPIMQMPGNNLLQDNNRQVHAPKENNVMLGTTTITTEFLNKPIPHFSDNIHEIHNLDGSYANSNEYKPHQTQLHQQQKFAPLTISNRSLGGHQNDKNELPMQPNLRVQQLLGPSMPNISNIMNTHSPLQKIQGGGGGGASLHLASPFENSLGIAKSMQNVNTTDSIIDNRHLQNKIPNVAIDYYAQQQHNQQLQQQPHNHHHHHQHLQQVAEIDKNQFQTQNQYDGMIEVMQQQQHHQQQQQNAKPQLIVHMQNQQKHDNNNVSSSPSTNNMETQQQQQQILYRMKRPILQPQQQQQTANQILEKPPLPPTATHPLFKTQIPSSVSSSSSVNYIDPMKSNSTSISGYQKKNTASNPWEREEREKEVEVRRGHIRMWREQQIEELSSLVQRSPQQEEQLKTLILERDFERRVQELHDLGDENEPTTYDKDHKESYNTINAIKMSLTTNPSTINATTTTTTIINPVSIIDDNYKNTHKDATSDFSEMTQAILQQNFIDNNNSISTKSELLVGQNQQFSFSNNTGTSLQPKSILKNNRYDVTTPSSPSKSHKSTSFADDRILQLEQQQQQQQTALKLTTDVSQLRDINNAKKAHVNIDTMALNTNDGSSGINIIEPPPPPERNSSFLLMARQSVPGNENGNEFTNNNNNHKKIPFTDNVIAQKKLLHFITTNNNNINNNNNNNDSRHVSFQENQERALQQKLEYSLDFEREFNKQKSIADLDLNFNNNNSFYDDASESPAIDLAQEPALWNTTIQSTPGVIGAQEVYRDPRQRRLAEKEQQLQQRNNEAVPEKLSFKEKMKMFALETGENQSPREKLKISKAQRDIDVVQ